jgi:hypothetical protein
MTINATGFSLFYGPAVDKLIHRIPYGQPQVPHWQLLLITVLMSVFTVRGILQPDGRYYEDGKPKMPAKLCVYLGIPSLLGLCIYMW